MKTIVNEGERALVFKDGRLVNYLKEGKYNNFSFLGKKHVKYFCEGIFKINMNLDILLKNDSLKVELDVINVKEDEIYLYYKDDIFQEVYKEGKNAFWKVIGKNTFTKIDLKEVFQIDEKIKNVFSKTGLQQSFDIIEIEGYNIGLYFRNGIFQKRLSEGTYAVSKKYYRNNFLKYDLRNPIIYNETMKKIFEDDSDIISDFDVKMVGEKELLLWYQKDIFKGRYLTGEYIFWNKLGENQFELIDLNNMEVIDEKYHNILNKVADIHQRFEIKEYEAGLLIVDNNYKKTLEPGVYNFWIGNQKIEVLPVDLRIKQLDMQGQEILTKDKIALRLNFVTQYKITDPVTNFKEINNLENQIYILLQIKLREYVGTQNLEQLLENKNEIAGYVLERIKSEEKKYGVEFLESGIKDIILPGDIKDILNTVLIAEKTAMANTVKRREETASTRSLLNTAKLMEENQTLYRLKEMEYIEKIVEKIGNIEISGNGNVLEELSKIFSKK